MPSIIFDAKVYVWLVIGLAVLNIALLTWLVFLETRLKKLFRGRKAKDLEIVLKDVQEELEYFNQKEAEMNKVVDNIERRLKRSAQHIGVVRFNPYRDSGGDQCFALAVLDETQNGFVVSSLYAREANRVFAKPIAAGKSQYQLSEEEKKAIEKALTNYV